MISLEKATQNGEKVYAKFRQMGRSHTEAKRDAENWVFGNYGLTVEIHPDSTPTPDPFTPTPDPFLWATWGQRADESLRREAQRYAEEFIQRRKEREREAQQRQEREEAERVRRESRRATEEAEAADRRRRAAERSRQHAERAHEEFERIRQQSDRGPGGEQMNLWNR